MELFPPKNGRLSPKISDLGSSKDLFLFEGFSDTPSNFKCSVKVFYVWKCEQMLSSKKVSGNCMEETSLNILPSIIEHLLHVCSPLSLSWHSSAELHETTHFVGVEGRGKLQQIKETLRQKMNDWPSFPAKSRPPSCCMAHTLTRVYNLILRCFLQT